MIEIMKATGTHLIAFMAGGTFGVLALLFIQGANVR